MPDSSMRQEISAPGGVLPAASEIAATAQGRCPFALRGIARSDVALAVWRRRLPPGLARWLAAQPPRRLPDARVLVALDRLGDAVAALLQPLPASPHREALHRDVCRLAALFASIADTPVVDIRLEAVTGDACWKFHRDNVRLRLLTTYRGPGTQIVPADHVEQALAQQRAYAGPLRHLPSHAVAVFKGARCDTAVLHRSPPLAGSGKIRLLLCINEPSRVSPPLWPRAAEPV